MQDRFAEMKRPLALFFKSSCLCLSLFVRLCDVQSASGSQGFPRSALRLSLFHVFSFCFLSYRLCTRVPVPRFPCFKGFLTCFSFRFLLPVIERRRSLAPLYPHSQRKSPKCFEKRSTAERDSPYNRTTEEPDRPTRTEGTRPNSCRFCYCCHFLS